MERKLKKNLPSQEKKIKDPRSRIHLAQDQQNLFVNESLESNLLLFVTTLYCTGELFAICVTNLLHFH